MLTAESVRECGIVSLAKYNKQELSILRMITVRKIVGLCPEFQLKNVETFFDRLNFNRLAPSATKPIAKLS